MCVLRENFGKAFWWKIISIAFILMIALKLIAQTGYTFLGESAYYEFFLGDLNQKLLMVFPTIILVELLKKHGFSRKTLSDFENPGAAIARIILNKDSNGFIDRMCDNQIKMQNFNIHHILDATVKNKKKDLIANLKLETVKFSIESHKNIKNFKDNSKHSLRTLISLMKNEVFQITPKKMKSFFFRIFSYQMRKPGKSYYWYIFSILISINLYIMICFPKLDYKKNKHFDVLQLNQSDTVTSNDHHKT